MAIFHMRMKSCARLNTPSKGPRSAISHASYISGQALTDHEYGDRFDTRASRHKEEVAHAEILAPVGAPGWVRDREMLWNRVHRAETRVNSRFARTLDIALPRELSEDAQLALARAYLHDEFVERGMVVDFAIHRDADGRNPHIHAMMTLRELEPEGFGKKRREWNARTLLHGWRRQWTEYANQTLAREGHDARIDHRSYQERGIELTGQKKLLCGQHVVVDEEHGARVEGVEGREMNARMLERLEEFREVAHRNGERICADPSIVLRAVSGNQAVFSKSEITRFIANHTDGAEQFQQALGIVMASPELVRLPGEQERYSTRSIVAVEKSMEAGAAALSQNNSHAVSAEIADFVRESSTLKPEQARAFDFLTKGSGDLAMMTGLPGTGKSFTLGQTRDAWALAGYEVIGAALAGKAAEGLQESSGIVSATLASWELLWENGRYELTSKHVLVVDEAGMLGTEAVERLVTRCRKAGAKLVLVGDAQQLQPIEHGAPMRMLADEYGAAELRDITRQKVDWQKKASVALSTGDVRTAMAAYREEGRVHQSRTHSDALDAIVADWAKARAEHPDASTLLMAFTKRDVRDLNERARVARIAAGELGEAQTVETERGAREIAVGERLYFLRNDRKLDVKNGSLGTVIAMEKGELLVRLDGDEPRDVLVDLAKYSALDHGYAATAYKAQGVTVDRAFLLATHHLEQQAMNVGMTRHRRDLNVHWATEDFPTFDKMVRTLGRDGANQMALDFAAVEEAGQRLEREAKPDPLSTKKGLEREARELRRLASVANAYDATLARQAEQRARERFERRREREAKAAGRKPPLSLEKIERRYKATRAALAKLGPDAAGEEATKLRRQEQRLAKALPNLRAELQHETDKSFALEREKQRDASRQLEARLPEYAARRVAWLRERPLKEQAAHLIHLEKRVHGTDAMLHEHSRAVRDARDAYEKASTAVMALEGGIERIRAVAAAEHAWSEYEAVLNLDRVKLVTRREQYQAVDCPELEELRTAFSRLKPAERGALLTELEKHEKRPESLTFKNAVGGVLGRSRRALNVPQGTPLHYDKEDVTRRAERDLAVAKERAGVVSRALDAYKALDRERSLEAYVQRYRAKGRDIELAEGPLEGKFVQLVSIASGRELKACVVEVAPKTYRLVECTARARAFDEAKRGDQVTFSRSGLVGVEERDRGWGRTR